MRCQLCGRRRPRQDVLFISWSCANAAECRAHAKSMQWDHRDGLSISDRVHLAHARDAAWQLSRQAVNDAVANAGRAYTPVDHFHANWQCTSCRQQTLKLVSPPF